MEAAPHPWPALGVLLLRDGLVDKNELEEILSDQRDARLQRISGRRLGEILIQRGRVTPTQVARLVAEQYELPFVDFDVADVDLRVATIMREEDARRFWAIPISRSADGTLLLAIGDPATVLFSDELRRLLGSVPRFAVVGPDAIEQAIALVYSQPPPSVSLAPEPSETADDLIVVEADVDVQPAETESALSTPSPAQSWPPLGALLLRDGLVTDDQLETALAQQRLAPSLRLGEILLGKGIVSRADIARLLSEQYELPFYELDRVEIDATVARRLPEEIAWRLAAVPIAEREDGGLDVAIADPTKAVYSDELHRALGAPLNFVVASPDDIEATLDRVHEPTFTFPTEESEATAPTEAAVVEETDDALEVGEPPHLVLESSVAEVLDLPAEEHEPSWPTRLELVEEIADDENSESPEPAVTELVWAPVAEILPPVEVEGESLALVPEHEAEVEGDAEAEVEAETEVEAGVDVELEASAEIEVEAETEVEAEVVPLAWDEEPDADEAEVYEFVWPFEHEEVRDEPSLEEDLALQVAQAASDVAEPSTADAPMGSDELVVFDIFGIGSLPCADSDATADIASVEEPVEQRDTAFASYHPLSEHVETEVAESLEDLSEPYVEPTSEADSEWALDEQVHVEPLLTHVETEPVALEPELDVEDELAAAPEELAEPEPELMAELEAAADTEHDLEHAVEPETLDDDVQLTDVSADIFDFDAVVADALAAGASTLHFSPLGDGLTVRARVDGLVRPLGTATPEERDGLVVRLESEGIARTHVVTTSRGPKTTIFVREQAEAPRSLEELGLDSDAAAELRSALESPAGAIVVCGPAGSGTTTTLYAALEAVTTPERVVATIEYPVERPLEGVDQIEVAPSAGVTFASALGDLRFTDTDAVLVGDLADRESASLALRAAREGRLVLAGLRAPDAVAAIVLLVEMGVAEATLASSLGCIVSQRLVRTVCTDCHETYYASEDELRALGQPANGSPRLLVRGTGCASCAGTGYRGRTAVFEVMPITDDLRSLVADGASPKKLRKAAVRGGMWTLRDEGIRLCLEGVTTVSEVARALGDDA